MYFEAQSHESVLKRLRPELGAPVASILRESEKGVLGNSIYEREHHFRGSPVVTSSLVSFCCGRAGYCISSVAASRLTHPTASGSNATPRCVSGDAH
jgi:hypothetical protein